MSNWHTLSTISETAMTFLVPAIVWTTLAAGLYDLVRDALRRVRLMPRRRLVQEGYGQ